MKNLIIVLEIVFGSMAIAQAQIEEITPTSRQTDEQVQKTFRYTSERQDTFSVKVINPHGDIQAFPVRSRPLALGSKMDFGLNTQFWLDGTYTILVEGEKGFMRSKDFRIRRKIESKRR